MSGISDTELSSLKEVHLWLITSANSWAIIVCNAF